MQSPWYFYFRISSPIFIKIPASLVLYIVKKEKRTVQVYITDFQKREEKNSERQLKETKFAQGLSN
jgi:hypothetical protein